MKGMRQLPSGRSRHQGRKNNRNDYGPLSCDEDNASSRPRGPHRLTRGRSRCRLESFHIANVAKWPLETPYDKAGFYGMAVGRTQARGFQPIPPVTEKCYSVRLFRRTVPGSSLPIPTVCDKM